MKNTENIAKIDAKGFQDLCNHYAELEKENEQLKANNQLMADELTYFKEYAADLEDDITAIKARCKELTRENYDLALENKDMKFTRKFLTAEDAGAAFARSLLGKPMTPEEVAISEAENRYDYYQGDDF